MCNVRSSPSAIDRAADSRDVIGGRSPRRPYDDSWQSYVEANIPFYSVLLQHFLTMCCGRIQANERDTLIALKEVRASASMFWLLVCTYFKRDVPSQSE